MGQAECQVQSMEKPQVALNLLDHVLLDGSVMQGNLYTSTWAKII